MNRYEACFAKGNAFVPFVVAGDPDPETSKEILDTLVRNGADMLEIGLPFSDPTADGPVIQLANERALKYNSHWDIIAHTRKNHPHIPIGLLVYANLVGDNFYAEAKAAGVDSVLIADVPTIEAAPYLAAARQAGISPVLIAAANTPDVYLRTIAHESEAYVYVVSRVGVTGVEQVASTDHHELMRKLTEFGAAPKLLGFGISTIPISRELATNKNSTFL